MLSMKIDCNNLVTLLQRTQRKQVVAGSLQDQVVACIIRADGSRASTCSLVKDGVTSLSVFSTPCEGTGAFPVSSISDLLGILKQHGNQVTLTYDKAGGRLKIKSGKKQTTITSNGNCRAFLHTPTLLEDWEKQSILRVAKFGPDGSYELKDGTKRLPLATFAVDANDLYEALRCDSINGQKMNKYTLSWNQPIQTLHEGFFTASVGGYTKGRTTTEIDLVGDTDVTLTYDKTNTRIFSTSVESFSCTYGGGLDNVLKSVNGQIKMVFLPFKEEGQGMPLLLLLHNGDFIFQAEILTEESK